MASQDARQPQPVKIPDKPIPRNDAPFCKHQRFGQGGHLIAPTGFIASTLIAACGLLPTESPRDDSYRQAYDARLTPGSAERERPENASPGRFQLRSATAPW